MTCGLVLSSGVIVTIPRKTLIEPPSQYSVTSCSAVNPVSMKALQVLADRLAAVPQRHAEAANGVFG